MTINFTPSIGNNANQLTQLQKQQQNILEKLATGKQINSASDNAAGLAISTSMRADIRSLGQAMNNVDYGISMVQTVDSSYSQMNDITSRLQELSIQASNGTLTDEQRSYINQEAQQLVQEIDSIAENTSFNNQELLTGTEITIAAGDNTESNITVSIESSTSSDLGLDEIDLSTQAGAAAAMSEIENAAKTVSGNQAEIGAVQNRMAHRQDVLNSQLAAASQSESNIVDMDVAEQTSLLIQNQVQQQAAIALMAQANISTESTLQLLG